MSTNLNNFPHWLEAELFRQKMIPAQLAQRMGKPNNAITRILNGERKPKAETLNLIADALNLPRADLYNAAGLMAIHNENSAIVNRIAYKVKKLSPEHQRIVDAFIDTLLNIGANFDKDTKQV